MAARRLRRFGMSCSLSGFVFRARISQHGFAVVGIISSPRRKIIARAETPSHTRIVQIIQPRCRQPAAESASKRGQNHKTFKNLFFSSFNDLISFSKFSLAFLPLESKLRSVKLFLNFDLNLELNFELIYKPPILTM